MPGALDGLQKTASELINKFGKEAVLTRVTLIQDQATGLSTETTSTEDVIISPPEPYETKRFPGITSEETTSVVSVAGQDVAEPNINDRMTFDGTVHQVTDKNAVYSGREVALWQIGLKT